MIKEGVVCGIIENLDGKILLLHRSPQRKHEPDTWYIMAGTIEEGESPENTLKRELKEELGITAYDILRCGEKYEGTNVKEVYTYLIRTAGPIIVDSREHDDWIWVTPDEVKKYKHPSYLKKDFATVGITI